MKNLEQKLAELLAKDRSLGMVLWDTMKKDVDLISTFSVELFVKELVNNPRQESEYYHSSWIFDKGYVCIKRDDRFPRIRSEYIIQWSTIQDNRKTMIWGCSHDIQYYMVEFILTHIINKELGVKPWTELNYKLNK